MHKKSERPLIAVFDSGIGGLNLLKACAEKIPQADFCYFADNYRMPYGNLPQDTIKSYAFEIFDKIAKMEPSAAVAACNTVTSCCIGSLRERYTFPVAGVQPAVKQAAEYGGKFLVLSTCATAESRSFGKLMSLYGGNATIAGCSGLAEKIEKNIFCIESFDASGYLTGGGYSSVVLGCTHYVYIKDKIKACMRCPVFDGIAGTADHLAKILGIFDHREDGEQKISFYGGDFVKNEAVYRILCSKKTNI